MFLSSPNARSAISQLGDAAGGSALVVPAPVGVAADDFVIVRDFFNAAPNGASIAFTAGATYSLFSGGFRARPGQIIDINGAVLQRAPEIVTKTTCVVANGATTVTLVSATGFQVGMAVNIKGAKVGESVNLLQASLQNDTNQALTIAAVDLATNTLTFEGPVYGITSITGGGVGALASGATIAVKGPLIDACSRVAGGNITIVNGILDGNRGANLTNNRWESTVELRVNSSGGYFDNFTIINSPGEAVVTNGSFPVFNNFKFNRVNGNLVHFNGWSLGTKLSQIHADQFNLDYSVGHANGGIIASNNTFNTIVDGFDLRGGRLFGIGSFDQSDNSFAKISNGFVANCWGGGLGLFGSNVGASSGMDVRNVRITNCGTSYLGMVANGTATVERARQYDIDIVLIDSLISLGGMADSRVKIRSYHSDTATLTPASVAAGRATNFAGKINGIPFNAGANLNLGVDLVSQVELSVSESTLFDIVQVDGASAPQPGTYGISTVYATDFGGPWLNCEFNLNSKGGSCGVYLQGVLRNCRGLLQSDEAKGAAGVYVFLKTNTNKNTVFPAAAAAGVVGVLLSQPGGGGGVVRAQYPLGFSGGGEIVAAKGSFVVENGGVILIQIDRPGSYGSAPALDFSAAPGLSGVVAGAALGPTQDYSVSDNNDFTVNVHHSSQPSGLHLLRLRQDAVNAVGSGWSTIRGKVRADAGVGAGVTDTGTAMHHIHLNDLEARGPAGGWNALQLTAAAQANQCRATNLRASAASVLPANWAVEPGATAGTAVAWLPH